MFYNSACTKQNEVCCSFTALSLCPNPCRQQDSSHQCSHFGRRKTPLVAGSELTVSESKNYPGYTVAFPTVPSQLRGWDVCWNDTLSRQLNSLLSEALQQHPTHNLPWRIFLLLLWCLWEQFHVFHWLLPTERVCLNYNPQKGPDIQSAFKKQCFTWSIKSSTYSGVFIEITEMHYFLQPSWVPAQKLYPLLHRELCRFWKEQTKEQIRTDWPIG